MNITEIKLMRRKNLGNYEHEELTFTAALVEGEDAKGAIIELKELMHAALENNLTSLESVGKTAPQVEKAKEEPTPPKEEKAKSAPRSRGKAAKETAPETNAEGQEIPPVIPEEAAPSNSGATSKVVGSVDTANASAAKPDTAKAGTSVTGKGIVAYDSTVKEHRSRFATFLGQNFPNWTPDAKFGKDSNSPDKTKYAQELQVFSKGLHGKPFEDTKGNMLESFKSELQSFFGA